MHFLILFSPFVQLRRGMSGWVGVWPLARVNLPHQYPWLWEHSFDLLEEVGFFFSGLPVSSISASVLSLAVAAAFLFFFKRKKKGNWTQEQKRLHKVASTLSSQVSPNFKYYFFTYYKTSPCAEKIYSYINARILILGNRQFKSSVPLSAVLIRSWNFNVWKHKFLWSKPFFYLYWITVTKGAIWKILKEHRKTF